MVKQASKLTNADDPADQQRVYVRTFGAFSLSTHPFSEDDSEEDAINISGRARRIWSLIAYLVVHRDREVPVMELIDMLWSEDEERDDPLKTLQHNVSRARDMLERHGLPNARELIVSQPGSYRWNSRRDTWVDIEAFQTLSERAEACEDPASAMNLHKQAIAIYRGDFLPGFEFDSWVTPISAYGRSLYVSQCLSLTRLLSGEENMSEIASVCEKALRFAPESEELNVRYIRALTAAACPEKAVVVYENVCKLLNDRLGVTPSPELELAYEEARQSLNGEAISIGAVRDLLREHAFDGKGMRCDWNSFLSLVRREARNARRANREAVVMAVTFDNENSAIQARRIEQVLAKRLRSGDVYTRLNSKQYLVLLPEAGEDNVRIIVDRLVSYYRQRFPRATDDFHCEWYCLEEPSEPAEGAAAR